MQNIIYSAFSLAGIDPHSEGIVFGAESISSHLGHASTPLEIRFHRRQLGSKEKNYRNKGRVD